MRVIKWSEIVEANGKTIRENNMEIPHNIPVGTLVEVKFSDWFGDGACSITHARLWVYAHERDCDGTPIYSLSEIPDPFVILRDLGVDKNLHKFLIKRYGPFGEDSLTVVEVTDELKSGVNKLTWD